VNGKAVKTDSPISAIRSGIAFTSENRKLDGLFVDMTIEENIVAPQLSEFSEPPAGFLNRREIKAATEKSIRMLNIRTSSGRTRVRKLSGGNQQKVLLSMWLGIKPEVLIVDEPTKGVDVGAKNEIFNILRDLADSGVAVIVISSELLEIIAISDRVLIVKDGRICGELGHQEVSEETIIAYASGVIKERAKKTEDRNESSY
jgi:ribose transport system ATP-binding protein